MLYTLGYGGNDEDKRGKRGMEYNPSICLYFCHWCHACIWTTYNGRNSTTRWESSDIEQVIVYINFVKDEVSEASLSELYNYCEWLHYVFMLLYKVY